MFVLGTTRERSPAEAPHVRCVTKNVTSNRGVFISAVDLSCVTSSIGQPHVTLTSNSKTVRNFEVSW